MQYACAVLYCHLWHVWLYQNIPHYLINGTIFRKVIEFKESVLIFSTNLLQLFLILRKIQSDIIITVHKSSRKVPLILLIF